MRETIELYGEMHGKDDNMKNKGVSGPFYCGMSFVMVIPQFNIRLNAPLSTSKSLEIAQRFGGMIYTYLLQKSQINKHKNRRSGDHNSTK